MKRLAATAIILATLAILLAFLLTDDPQRETPSAPPSSATGPAQLTAVSIVSSGKDSIVNELLGVPVPGGATGNIDPSRYNCPTRAPRDSTNPEDIEEHTRQIHAEFRAIADQLARSSDPALLAAAAQLKSAAGDGIDLASIDKALQIDPGNGLVAWTWMNICDKASGAPECIDDAAIQRAIRIDDGNALVWARLASRRYAQGNVAKSFDALERAVAAPRMETYWGELVDALRRASAHGSERTTMEQVMFGFGIAATMVLPYAELAQACEAAAKLPGRARLCLDFARRLQNEAGTTIDSIFGLAIETKLARLTGDTKTVATLEERRHELNELIRRINGPPVSEIMWHDEQVLLGYVERSGSSELSAIEFVVSEAERLAAIPGYSPCPGAGRP